MDHITTADQALRHLRAPDQRNMGRAQTAEYGEATAEILAEIEATAVTVRSWNPLIIPGLLQTQRYATAAIRTACPSLPGQEVARRAQVRMDRIQAFRSRWEMENSRVGRAFFMIGQAAITKPIQPAGVHAYTLAHVLNLSRTWPGIDIRILPDDVPTPGLAGQFTLYALEGTLDETGNRRPGPRMGYLETLIGGWYTTRMEDVSRFYQAFAEMLGAAMSPTETRHVIQREQEKCWNTMEHDSSSPPTPTPGTA